MSASATHQPSSASSGVDMKTLLITAAASAIAAYACSKLWTPGTLVAAAFTPVIVAILKDVLAKSTDVVARAAPVRGIVRSTMVRPPAGAGAAPTADPSSPPGSGSYPTEVQPQPADPYFAQPAPHPSLGDPLMPPVPPQYGELPIEVEDDPADRVPQPGEITYHGAGGTKRGLRVAIVTGVLGFLLAAAVMTVPELAAGGSASGNGRGTTFFGGGKDREADDKQTDKQTEKPSDESRQQAPSPATETVTGPEEETTTVPEPDALPPTGGDAAPLPEDPDADVERSPDVVVAPPG